MRLVCHLGLPRLDVAGLPDDANQSAQLGRRWLLFVFFSAEVATVLVALARQQIFGVRVLNQAVSKRDLAGVLDRCGGRSSRWKSSSPSLDVCNDLFADLLLSIRLAAPQLHEQRQDQEGNDTQLHVVPHSHCPTDRNVAVEHGADLPCRAEVGSTLLPF